MHHAPSSPPPPPPPPAAAVVQSKSSLRAMVDNNVMPTLEPEAEPAQSTQRRRMSAVVQTAAAASGTRRHSRSFMNRQGKSGRIANGSSEASRAKSIQSRGEKPGTSSVCVKTRVPNSNSIIFRWPEDGSRLEVRPSGVAIFYGPDGSSFKIVRKSRPPLHSNGVVVQTDTRGLKYDVLVTERCISRKMINHSYSNPAYKHQDKHIPPPPDHKPPEESDVDFENYFDMYANDGNNPLDLQVFRRRLTVEKESLSLSRIGSTSFAELYGDELAYLNVLVQLKEHYVTPLTLYCDRKGLSNPFIGFPLDRTYQLNIGFLHDIHQAAAHVSSAKTQKQSIANVLGQFLSKSHLKHYTTLIGMIDVVIEQIEQLKKKKLSVADFVTCTENDLLQQYEAKNRISVSSTSKTSGGSCGSLVRSSAFSLTSMVTRPKKRIKEYQKLVSRLLKQSTASKPGSDEARVLKMVQGNLKSAVATRALTNARNAALRAISMEEQRTTNKSTIFGLAKTLSQVFSPGRVKTSGKTRNSNHNPKVGAIGKPTSTTLTAKDVAKYNRKKLKAAKRKFKIKA